ncbi:S-adenosyl-L-methionine-dependent methyltransferase [Microdochium trichocladiopsis]|uniref:type I protein arginine methyltransferase n=1 Tax=Microdochium trichocladiopsis TaxID=1682393 RepID=A0A9P8YHH0_9PEZI|nr:S-adenosyl-L-methionine-dependent methyltransferase [Microdochium trichocladiopsis]KAH7040087.1 S-adenosyl-L-methionine-dependent methyltransferase [Microdochium trichocladiopsis]
MASRPERSNDPLSDSESSSIGSRADDEGWDDVEADEEESVEVVSLLDDRVFPDVLSMLAYCKEKHSFDFLAVRQKLQLDFHGSVKLVNYVRQRVRDGNTVTEDISSADISSDEYLKPVLDDDAVILGLFDLPEVTADAATGDSAKAASPEEMAKRNAELEEQLARMTLQFDNYRQSVQQLLDERWGDADQAEAEAKESGKGKAAAEEPLDPSRYYWESYAGNDIHETMLKDTVRTEAYRDFIYHNKHLFKGKTVLDIGCGTGILSMFCAKAGAAKVLAVDASAIIAKARENVFRNGLDSTITCIHGKIEEVTLPVDKVDIIVSEWMGYCLLFEAMLPSVLFARDKYLKPDGLLVPSHTNIWLAPVADPEYVDDNISFWRDVYGFDMQAMQTGIYADTRVLHMPQAAVAGKPAPFKLLDHYTCKTEDLSFTAPYTTKLSRDIDNLDGFLVWFDTFFAPARDSHETDVVLDSVADEWKVARDVESRVAFTTGPYNTETHWRQGLLLCKPEEGKDGKVVVEAAKMKEGDEIKGDITFAVDEEHARALALKMTWNGKAQSWALK